jgi:hypothetical protein
MFGQKPMRYTLAVGSRGQPSAKTAAAEQKTILADGSSGAREGEVPGIGIASVATPSASKASLSADRVLKDAVKLVVWDLDDTFWRGVLSEEPVLPVAENIELVKRLAARGIVSSICSKTTENP